MTGEARYCSRTSPVPHPAYAYLVTSAIARGRSTSFDARRGAKAVPGVARYRDAREHGEARSEFKFFSEWRLCFGHPEAAERSPEICHDGQIIAMVLAETFEAAREAAHQVKVNYEASAADRDLGFAGTETAARDKVSPRPRRIRRSAIPAEALAQAEVTIDAAVLRRRPSTTIRWSCSPRPASGTTTS